MKGTQRDTFVFEMRSAYLSLLIQTETPLNYFRPHRNPIVFSVANASYIFTALSFVSTTILVHFHESESPRTRFFIGAYLITLDVMLIGFALLAVVFSFVALKRKVNDIKRQKRRTMHVRMHHHGLIKLEDDGAGGFLMPLDDNDADNDDCDHGDGGDDDA